jgi:predicted glutamine amidotransferase
MCIIVVKKEGYKIPDKTILKNCFENNSDGAGLMYYKDNKVVINKGFMDFESFYNKIEKLQNEIDTINTNMVFHFRIGTSGASDGTCTHPFELTNNSNKLKKLNAKVDVGIAHNGIINAYTPAKTSDLNDTQLFIKNFLYPLYEIDNNFYNNTKIQDIIKTVTSSKFAILTNKNELVTIGDFIEEDGILYSNTSYEDYYSYYKNYSLSKYEDYEDFYDYLDVSNLPFDEAINKLYTLSDDEYATDDDFSYIPYDYRKAGKLAIDKYNSLYLIDYENKSVELISDYVELFDILECESVTK